MYLNASTDSIEIILGGTVTANQLQWNVSYQDITSSGMTLPQSAGAGLTNNATLVTMVAAPAASTTRQVTNINVYNADTATATVTIRKDVSGTKYVLIRYALTTLDTLMWSREDGWRVMSATGGGTTYTFSTGLTNTSGTITNNLSTGVAGGQSVIGGTAASNNLTLSSTSNATKGKILFGTSAYDEVNNRLGIGTASPLSPVHIELAPNTSNGVGFYLTKGTGSFFAGNGTNNTANFVATFIGVPNYDETGLYFQGNLFNTTTVKPAIIFQSYNFSSSAGISAGQVILGIQNATTRYVNIYSNGNVVLQNGGVYTDSGYRLDVNGTLRSQGDFTISTKNIITDGTTGTKIGTATSQKLGFWNATPIVQPTTGVAAATVVAVGGTNIQTNDTFDGYTLAQVVKALRNTGILA